MTEAKETKAQETKAKPKTGKPPAVKSETAPAIKPAKTVKVKPAVKVKAPSKAKDADGKIKVTQLVGCIARREDQRATLIGLGLNKRHRVRVLENTPSVRGMVYKVRHLVTVEKIG